MAETYNVLIIDDSEDDVLLYRRLLRTDPAIGEIRSAESGNEGLALYEAEPTGCILLDYHLPGEDGCEVMRLIRERDRHAAIIMLTGQESEPVAAAALMGGASDYIIKDKISAAGLRRAVRNAVIKAGLQRQLEAQQEAHDKLLLRLIHDLRAPLRHAVVFSGFLGEDLAESRYAELAPYPGKIQGALERATTLMDMLFAYLQVESIAELAPVSLRTAADAAVAEIAPLFEERGARLEFGQLPAVHACPHRLAELLRELFKNAILYSEAETPTVRVEAAATDDGGWQVSVSDNGPGIPEGKQAEIFDPLNRLHSYDKIAGSGLGLSICQRIVQAHGGRIWCESEPGRGSVFHFTLPGVAETDAASEANSRSAA